jgi:prepilin-type N-terminal cleavage/methylation domain-containing protein
MQRGFTLVELLVVVAIIAVLSMIAAATMRDALVRSHIGAAATDAHAIYVAFKRYHVDNNMYPNASSDPSFQLDSFEPLVSMGYYDGRLSSRLLGGQADGYDSPDDQGSNREFWLEFTLAYEPSVRFLVSDSDDSPMGGGEYYDGIFMFRDGVLTPL